MNASAFNATLWLTAVVVFPLSFGASGCGTKKTSTQKSNTQKSSTQKSGTTSATQSGEIGFSPLNEALGLGGTPEQVRARGHLLLKDANDAIVKCMVDKGFKFTLETPIEPVREANLLPTEPPENMTRSAWVLKNGYGVTNSIKNIELIPKTDDPDLAMFPADVNEEYRKTLSPQQQLAYEVALSGERSADGASSLKPGCAEMGSNLDSASIASEELSSKEGALEDQILEDVRLVQIEQRWSDCMATKGHDIGERANAPELVNTKIDELTGKAAGGKPEKSDTLSVEDTMLSKTQLEVLGRFELSVAGDDVACRVDKDDILALNIRTEYERDFVKANKKLLAEYNKYIALENSLPQG